MAVSASVYRETDLEIENCTGNVLEDDDLGRNAGSSAEQRKKLQGPQWTLYAALNWDGLAEFVHLWSVKSYPYTGLSLLSSDPWGRHMDLCKLVLFQVSTERNGPPKCPCPAGDLDCILQHPQNDDHTIVLKL